MPARHTGEHGRFAVHRIIGLGAVRAGVGQRPQATWVVLADLEGNEFCVLRPKKTLLD
jgi:hypothetical protein